MDINKKIKGVSIFIALIMLLLSVGVTANTRLVKEDEAVQLAEIQKEMEEQAVLDAKLAEAKKKLSVDEKYNAYISFCDATGDVTDTVKSKKAELKLNADTLKAKAAACSEELEKIYNSVGFTNNERVVMIDEFYVGEKYKALSDTLSKCDSLKTEIENAVKTYNEEQEAKKKAAAQNSSSKSGGSSSNRSSGSSSNYSRNYSSGGSSGGGSYSGSSSGGASSGGYSGGGSSSGESSSGSSSSGSSSSVSSESSSDASLGSER